MMDDIGILDFKDRIHKFVLIYEGVVEYTKSVC